jgi:carboxylesterase type B
MCVEPVIGFAWTFIFDFSAVNAAYRLGAFGFMASAGLTKEKENANAGLLDQRFAVEWVKENIAA